MSRSRRQLTVIAHSAFAVMELHRALGSAQGREQAGQRSRDPNWP
jgi:hypothetical protein